MRYFFCLILSLVTQICGAQSAVHNADSAFNVRSSGPVKDSLYKAFHEPLRLRNAYAPAALLTTGIISATVFKPQWKYKIVEERNRLIPGFHTNVDDYLQYAPIPIAYGLDALGFKSEHDILNRSMILLKGEALMLVSVNMLKYTTKELRPDGSNPYSFPSGHTAQAFAAATFLSEEYKNKYHWMPYLAYSMAATTGLLRIANNRHFVGDVLMGAGLGMLSMKVSYWTHQYLWGKKHHDHKNG